MSALTAGPLYPHAQGVLQLAQKSQVLFFDFWTEHHVLEHDVVVEAVEHRTLRAMDSLGDDTNGDGECL